MKKKILISLVLSSSILIANAQWSGNTSSIEGNLWRNGNVGIGVDAPSEKLEVNSTILINSPQSRGSSFLRLQRGPEGSDNATISFGQNSTYNWHTGLLYAAGNSTPNFYISQSHQITDPTGTLVHIPELTIATNGNIGIGQIMPTEKLEVNSTILINNPVSRGSSFLRLQRGPEGSDNATISFGQNSTYNWHTGLLYSAGNSTPNFYISQSHQIYNSTGTLVHTPELTISTNGNVGIGTTTPTSKLTVKGKIEAEEIEVKNVAADFVFDKNYKLRSLKEVEEFININGHLPEVAPANETAKGINLGAFNQTILQKVEELTLYVIALKKENDALKAKVDGLK